MRSFIEIHAPAKLNLGLKILGKRPDGFHEIITTFVAINLYDRLRFTRLVDGGVRLRLADTSGTGKRALDFPLGESNLILRAVRQVEQALGQKFDLSIEVDKRIPTAAGLGGGSADAAATLFALTRLYDLAWPPRIMSKWARELGSDVPFFLGASAAEGRGRGEKLRPLKVYTDWWAILICPSTFLSAKEVYGQLNLTSRHSYSSFSQSCDGEGFFAALGRSHNDLEVVVARRVPDILHWKEGLTEIGAEGVFVSGSGPTVYGVFRRQPSTEAVRNLQIPGACAHISIVQPVITRKALKEL